jgi:DNA-binding transcriptional ArsR family regulator
MQATGTERDALDAVTARFFKGLGDVNRLKILEFLKGGGKAVGAIVEHVGLPQNQDSMHLRYL